MAGINDWRVSLTRWAKLSVKRTPNTGAAGIATASASSTQAGGLFAGASVVGRIGEKEEVEIRK
jgi:hypothetical protein